MVRISNGTNDVATGETHAHAYRREYAFDNTYRGVILCHGGGTTEKYLAGTSADVVRDSLRYVVLTDGAGTPPNRYTILGSKQSSGVAPWELFSWGNANSSAMVGDALTYLQAAVAAKSGKVALIGHSMGFLVACNWARDHASSVAGIIGINPACDLSWFRGTDNRHDFKCSVSSINTARTVITLGGAMPSGIVTNINSQPPWQFVVKTAGLGGTEVDRKPIASATSTQITLSVGLDDTGAISTREYHARPQNDDGSGTFRDFGSFYDVIELVYPAFTTDSDFNSSGYPTRSPLSYALTDPCYGLPARLYYNAGDEVRPPQRPRRWSPVGTRTIRATVSPLRSATARSTTPTGSSQVRRSSPAWRH